MTPSEIARETLRQLAMRRTLPTPDNYRALYDEIAGNPPVEPLHWSDLIRGLVAQYEARHAGVTPARKRKMLDHVLVSSGTPEKLFDRLQSLAKSWSQGGAAEDMPFVGDGAAPVAAGGAAPQADAEMRELFAQLLENAVGVLLVDTPELAQEASALSADMRAARTPEQIAGLAARLKKFSYRLQFVAEDQAELKAALLHLLQLIIENINELVVDDDWLHGQVSMVSDIVGQQPISLRRLDDVERRMKDLIYKQSALKKNLNEARDRLKAMLAAFVDRLADLSSSTGHYHSKIEQCAEKIGRAGDISEISDVLDEVMSETRIIQLNAQRSRDELIEMRTRVEEAEKEIHRLHDELTQASDMVRHDPLTGTLNRKGMDEAVEREVKRVRRHNEKICVALLDVDNFKKLNDSLGHQAGDQALVHLAQVTQQTIRPQDTLARYGGEEFIVLLPDTALDDAVKAMVRVQRELTRKFFLHKNDKILITFSCGVVELAADEVPNQAIKRADDAMYLAKRAGKNRVVAA
ncbi:MAG: diguanylate cyclase [Candidatus Nitricoxidivorans perseverans]|uniref:diguanylate cyclase n=1 Tax=Candidatus Nitricoxidivorans perseverans TaxID=2975601 RepID=A0AA49FM91_9PROT|nr:MAG: diguanylate cyclase [Candidatus Nitricoxidivorans perseverans]